MKKACMFSMLVAGVAAVVLADEAPVTKALWLFNDGAPGTTVASPANEISNTVTATAKQDSGVNHPLVYSDDIPGRYVYLGADAVEPAYSSYQSIRCEKNEDVWLHPYLKVEHIEDELGDIGSNISYTVECFFKPDANANSSWKCFMGAYAASGKWWKAGSGTSAGTFIGLQWLHVAGNGQYVTTQSSTVADRWHHVAFAYDAETQTVRMYLDYTITTATMSAEAVSMNMSGLHFFTLYSDNSNQGWPGWIACPRVTRGKLPPEQFLRVSSQPSRANATPDMIGLWALSDKTNGQSVTYSVNLYDSFMNPFYGTRKDATVDDIRASDEVPGMYLIDGCDPAKLITDNYKSFRFEKFDPSQQNSAAQSGMLGYRTGRTLSSNACFTVEMFYKYDVSRGWNIWNNFFSTTVGGRYWKLALMSINQFAPQWLKENRTDNTTFYLTNGWHHVAVVCSNNAQRVYLDYAPLAFQSDYRDLGNAWWTPLTNSPTASAIEFKLGDVDAGYNGLFAAPRIVTRALEPDEFLRAVDSLTPNSTVLDWGFEEGKDGEKLVSTPSRDNNGYYLGNAGYGSTQTGTYTNTVYERVWPDRTEVYHGDRLIGETKTAVRLFGKVESGWNDWFGTLVAANSQTALTELPSFTAECYFRAGLASFSQSCLLMAQGFALQQGNGSWRVGTQGSGTITWSATVTTNDTGETMLVSGSFAPGGTFGTSRWHHVAFTYDEPTHTVKIYYDHQLQVEQDLGYPLYRHRDPFAIGRGMSYYGFTGWIDEVRISDRVLEPEEFVRVRFAPGTLILFQ